MRTTGGLNKPNLNEHFLGCNSQGGCTLVWWLAPLPHSERVPSSTPGCGLPVWSLHVPPVYAWVLSGYSGFLLLSKTCMLCSLVSLKMTCGCLSRLSLCLALRWTGDLSRLYPASRPMTAGIGSSSPATRPTDFL